MANYANIIAEINAAITSNQNQDITGPVLNAVLRDMVATLGAGYQYKGVATPSTDPGTPDQKVFYIATQSGTYTNFGSLAVTGISVLRYDNIWRLDPLGIPEGRDLVPNLADVVPDYFGGYIKSDSKISYNNNTASYRTIRKRVVEGKKYLLITPSSVPSASYYVFAGDYDGQIPVGTRTQYKSNSVNIITAPSGAKYIFVCVRFSDAGASDLFVLVEEYGQYENILRLWPNVSDVAVNPVHGYINGSSKFESASASYDTLKMEVVEGKKYLLLAPSTISSTPYYVWTSDIEGQTPVGTRVSYTAGINTLTAPAGANFLFVSTKFSNVGNTKGFSLSEWNVFLQQLSAGLARVDGLLEMESRNVYDQTVENGYINTSDGVLASTSDSRYKTTGRIPVKPNSFYYISGNRCSVSAARCLGSDGTTRYKLLSARSSQPLTAWRIPNEMATDSTKNGQFKTPPDAAFLQFTIDFNQSLENPERVMVEYVGDEYNPLFVPSSYQPYNAHTIVKMDALPQAIVDLPARVLDLELGVPNAPKVLLIGSSHGMNTIGQFPILAYHSGYPTIVCANAYKGAMTLQQLAEYCTSGSTFDGSFKVFGGGVWNPVYGALTVAQMLLYEKWDVISIQRSAEEDDTWTAAQASYLETILAFITATCDWGPKVVFNSGFADSYSIATRSDQQYATSLIWSSAQQVKEDYGLDIIPMAPALQMLRNNDTIAALGSYQYGMLSCDDQHLDQGIGMYASGCICFNFFLRHLFRDVMACKYLPTAADMQPYQYAPAKFTSITEANAKLIRRIVCQYFANN